MKKSTPPSTKEAAAAHVKQAIREKLVEHKRYIAAHGLDMPEVRNWRWPGPVGGAEV